MRTTRTLLGTLPTIALWVLLASCSDDPAATTDGATTTDGAVQRDASVDRGPTSDTKTDAPATDATAPDAIATDGATGDGNASCPTTAPSVGAGCSTEGLQCAFNTQPACGDVWECVDSKWMVVFAGMDCATRNLPACPNEQPTGFCAPGDWGTCRYDITVCRCDGVCSGVPPPPGEEYAWACAAPQTGACPKQVPQANAACTKEGLQCGYGSCGGYSAVCTSGTWKVTLISPPP